MRSHIVLSLVLTLAGVRAGAEPAPPPPGQFEITAESVEARETPRGRVFYLEDRVTIRRDAATLVGDHGVYREAEGLAIVHGSVHGDDEGAAVACDTLKYFRDLDVAILTGGASFADTSGVIRASRIEIYRDLGLAVATDGATVVDVDGTSRLAADRIVYDVERREARASGEPLLTTYAEDGSLDATVTSDVIEIYPDAETVRAISNARIDREDVAATARVATISGRDESLLLEGEPVVEQGSDRLTADAILVLSKDDAISRVIARGGARADYHIESEEGRPSDERGHVGGDTLTMFFEDGEPSFTAVRGDAESVHLLNADGESNTVRSPMIDVVMSEGRISRASFLGRAEGTYTFLPEEPDEARERSEDAASGGERPSGSEDAGGGGVETEDIAYRADRIDYYVRRNRIVLSGAATVEYRETLLGADRVVFDPDNEVLTAEGAPDLVEGAERLVGESLAYDLEGSSGTVSKGTTLFEDGLYYGERISRESDGTLLVRGGVYTTCAHDPPHYRLESNRMKVYIDDKVVAKPVILYVGEIPVFGLPFYVFPIRKDRHSGFLIPQLELGLSENRGRFVRNFGYYWAPNDYWDATAWGDYYEQTKWIAHLETRYKLRYTLSGSVNTSFMEELADDKRRWDLHVRHRQELGRNWSASASADFRSDAAYAQDANQSILESVNRSLHSQLWLQGRWSHVTAGVTLDRREELDLGTISELLPKAEISASQRPLITVEPDATGLRRWLAGLSYRWNVRAVNDRDRSGGETVVRQGLGASATIRGSGKVLGVVNLSPSVTVREDIYDRDRGGRRFADRLTYDARVSLGTTLYGTFFPRIGRLEALRHIVEPSISYSWTPEFGEYFDASGIDRFYTFSGFGGTPRARKAVGVSLVNKLQARVAEGESVRKLDSLLRFSTSSSYDFRKDDRRWADVSSQIELRPGGALSARWTTSHDPYGWTLQRSTLTTTLNLTGRAPVPAAERWEDRIGEDVESPVAELRRELAERMSLGTVGERTWNGAVSFKYSRGADPDDSSFWVDGSAAFSPTPLWRVNYSVHYDVKNAEIASQEYAIYRDMHCWEAQFVQRYYDGEWQYYFRINVKALPDIQAETGEKHLKRSFG